MKDDDIDQKMAELERLTRMLREQLNTRAYVKLSSDLVKSMAEALVYSICTLTDLRKKNRLLKEECVAWRGRSFEGEQFLFEVSTELVRARAKFPSNEGLLAALTEEVGEVAKAVMEEPWENVRKECVQVAAVAMRLAEEGDTSLDRLRFNNRVGDRVGK